MPELSVLVSTYQRPGHLYRCLLSLASQKRCPHPFEVIVTDDGSTDETIALVKYFSNLGEFPIKLATHEHADFQLSRCRNEGIALASAPYILITDGDCIFPQDHLYWHMKMKRPGTVIAGDCYRLSESASDQIDERVIREGRIQDFVDAGERSRIRGKAIRASLYSTLPLKMLPRVSGNNIGVWRADLERINGFDENFIGWGLEDRDLQLRLWMSGVRTRSILHRTAAYHLWHPVAPSFARNGSGTNNLAYFKRESIPSRCEVGLAERAPLTKNIFDDEQYIEEQANDQTDRLSQLTSRYSVV